MNLGDFQKKISHYIFAGRGPQPVRFFNHETHEIHEKNEICEYGIFPYFLYLFVDFVVKKATAVSFQTGVQWDILF